MKNRNTIIICLAVIGIALLGTVQFIFIPRSNAEQNRYLAAQQEPATHDVGSILQYKSLYMGDASNDINLFHHLPLNSVPMDFELFPDSLEIEVNYKDTVSNIGEEKVKSALLYNSTAAFALIDNLKGIDYNFSGSSYQVSRADIESLYPDFKNILEKDNWSGSVQTKLNDNRYVEDAFQRVMKTK